MAEVNAVEKQPVTQEYLKKMDAYWRAALQIKIRREYASAARCKYLLSALITVSTAQLCQCARDIQTSETVAEYRRAVKRCTQVSASEWASNGRAKAGYLVMACW